MNAVISAAASLIGVVLGAVLSRFISHRQRRLEMTFDLHREYHAADMMKARYGAAELLAEHPDLDYAQLRREVGFLGIRDLRQVVFFYQRLWFAIENGALQDEYVPRLFGDSLSWWYLTSFESKLCPTSAEAGRDIERLWEWMNANSDDHQRSHWRGADPDVWSTRRGTG